MGIEQVIGLAEQAIADGKVKHLARGGLSQVIDGKRCYCVLGAAAVGAGYVRTDGTVPSDAALELSVRFILANPWDLIGGFDAGRRERAGHRAGDDFRNKHAAILVPSPEDD